jgi:aryl-alcohol dehydrogenase-like predicted oxidoreductase
MSYLEPNRDLYGIDFQSDSFHGMPCRKFGRTGLSAGVVGLGTWKFGLPETNDGSRVGQKEAFAIFDRAWELGATLWDTANRYNDASGNSERVIGRWFAANPQLRRDVVLATKLCGLMDGRTPNHAGLSRQNIVESVYASLERLQTDHIDLLYFHAADPSVDPEESIAAVDDLIRQDMVRYFAVSNFTAENLRAYEAAQASAGSVRTRIAAVQNGFDLLRGEHADKSGVFAYCAEKKISFLAWSPLAEGLLTGRYNDPAKIGSGDRLFDQKSGLYANPVYHGKLMTLAEIARGAGVTMTQLVLAYMLTLPAMTHVHPAAGSPAQLEDNAKAASLRLSEEIRSRIRACVGC